MLDNITFELAKTSDVTVLLAMMEDFYAIDNYPFNAVLTQSNLELFINNPQYGEVRIIFGSNGVIGYFILANMFSFEYGGQGIFIDELYVINDYRQRGIGNLALVYIENKAISDGVKVIQLEVERHNLSGVKLYLKRDFMDSGRNLLVKKCNEPFNK
jgi:ribosomal protein S18 acetylase RimI-like enzyme